MASEEPMRATPEPAQDAPMASNEPAAGAGATKKRPRLVMESDPRERKRGKSMFGLVLGTLNKAKNEDRARNESDAAKKRQTIEKRLQDKLRKETDSVRRAEEAKKDKTSANRKEEELQLKDSIHKLRRTRQPLLANFLLTSDVIPPVDSDSPTSTRPPAPPLRVRPPPLYYLPAKLLPVQEAFLEKRKAEVKEAAEKEWEAFREERSTGVDEIKQLRERVAEEESRRKTERSSEAAKDDVAMSVTSEGDTKVHNGDDDGKMDVDDGRRDEKSAATKDKKDDGTPTPAPGDDDDAVEY